MRSTTLSANIYLPKLWYLC